MPGGTLKRCPRDTARGWATSTWLQLHDCTHFPLAAAHSVTSASAFQSQPAEQGKSARVKGNRIPASFFFHHEQIASCSEQVSNQSPVRNRRGLSSCEADVSVRWDYSYMLSSRRNGCLPNLQCNTERLFLVLQSPEIAGLVSTATDRQIHSKWQQFLVFTLFASALSACIDRSMAVKTALPCWEKDVVKFSLLFSRKWLSWWGASQLLAEIWERPCSSFVVVSNVPVSCLCR